MEVSVEILEPASSYDLLSLEEAKAALNISGDTFNGMLQSLISAHSSSVSILADRIFARERVIETINGVASSRIYLSHFPVKEDDIEIVEAGGVAVTDYLLDERSGKLSTPYQLWAEPVVVTYTGGYNLPTEAPAALKQIGLLLMQEKFTASGTLRDAGIRMISHKESRVMYYDQSAAASKGGSSGGSATQKAVDRLLFKFTRLWA